MARVEKYGKTTVGNLFAHFERRQKVNKRTGEKEYVKFGNRDIDTRWTPLNYRVWPPLDEDICDVRELHVAEATRELWERTGQDAEEPALKRYRRIVREVQHSNRRDLKTLCDWCISLPDEIPAVRMTEFFDVCLRYCVREYGAENIAGAWVHVDEAHRPHLDVAFVPVVDRGTDKERISAKDLLNRKHLKGWHDNLTSVVKKEMHIDNPGILNGRTAAQGGNRTVKQMKRSDKAYDRTKGKEVDLWRSAQLKKLEKAEKLGKATKLDNLLTDALTRKSEPLKEPRNKTLGEYLRGR